MDADKAGQGWGFEYQNHRVNDPLELRICGINKCLYYSDHNAMTMDVYKI